MMESTMEWEDPSSVGGCDRRLSRAARRLLETSLRSFLGNDGTGRSRSSSSSTTGGEDDVWILLEQWLRQAQPSECPLFPSRDCLRYEEEQSIPIQPLSEHWHQAIPLTTLKEQRRHQLQSSHHSGRKSHHYHSSPSNRRWWKCGICHKVFLSRYYMDLHWNTHHLNSEGDCGGTGTSTIAGSDSQRLVCPAQDWCRMMGMANCYQQALMDEPYYDRGSSTGGDDHGKMLHHKFSKLAQSIPCHDEDIQRDCRTMLEACRVTDPTMITQWCESWTCPSSNSPSFLWSASSTTASSLLFLVPDEWRRIWMSETYGYSYSGLIIGLLVMVAIYAWLYYIVMMGPSGPSNKGLIVSPNNKYQRKNSSSSQPRPTTVLYDPVPTSWFHPSSTTNKQPPPTTTWRKVE